jgi:nitrite reductase/ring-hydroxylating ferredoxin subunit/uncharacterized membrane protein
MSMPPLKDVLEGKPVRAPLHPMVVHLPIALFPLSVLLDAASWILAGGNPALVRGAFVCLVVGLITGVIAGVLGMVDYTDIREDHPAKKKATAHLLLNVVALGLFAVGAGLRYGQLGDLRTAVIPLVISVAGLMALSYGGYLGGHLVYSDGIGVGRHRRRTRTPQSTIGLPALTGSVAVADEQALGEGETLRVEVNGRVMMIARCGGRLYAVQEFCTHRFGPLSEGALRGCEVVCPWHKSRFDLRTGKVTEGPAKVELRTWHVEARDGRIWVDVD